MTRQVVSTRVGAGWWVDGRRGFAMLTASVGIDPEQVERPPDVGLFVGLPAVFMPAELPPPGLFVQSLGIVPGIVLQRDPEEVLWGVAQVRVEDGDAVGFDVVVGRLEGALSSFVPAAFQVAIETGLAVIERTWPTAWPLSRVVVRPIGLVVERPARVPAPPVPEA